jgi:homoserine dehydrogenase
MYRDPVESLEPQSSHAAALAPRPLRVGMIGIGTVGSGTFRVLARNQAEIAGRAGRGIKLVMVCARSLARAMRVVGRDVALTNDPMLVATHPDVDVVVEVARRHQPRTRMGAGRHPRGQACGHGQQGAAGHARQRDLCRRPPARRDRGV